MALPLLPPHGRSTEEKKRTKEREWCVGRRVAALSSQRANAWRRQGSQRCMRLERSEAHAEGLVAHDAGRDAISGGLGFPFSSPYASHFLPRVLPFHISFLLTSARARTHTYARARFPSFFMIDLRYVNFGVIRKFRKLRKSLILFLQIILMNIK